MMLRFPSSAPPLTVTLTATWSSARSSSSLRPTLWLSLLTRLRSASHTSARGSRAAPGPCPPAVPLTSSLRPRTSSFMRCLLDGSTLEISWTLESFPSAVRNPSEPDPITSAKRMVSGLFWLGLRSSPRPTSPPKKVNLLASLTSLRLTGLSTVVTTTLATTTKDAPRKPETPSSIACERRSRTKISRLSNRKLTPTTSSRKPTSSSTATLMTEALPRSRESASSWRMAPASSSASPVLVRSVRLSACTSSNTRRTSSTWNLRSL
mmetsp:Transcript_15743/g.29906  ORF Transcript_15743/g.29906 Transcript_15743/m.29906 type:complete len:265 (+) Transcript_15743:920-1714(+)